MSNQEEKAGATKEEKITTNGEHQEKVITEEDDIPETRSGKEKFAKVEAELEDLRKFKADVEAVKMAQAETEEKSTKSEVNASNTFFGRDGQTSRTNGIRVRHIEIRLWKSGGKMEHLTDMNKKVSKCPYDLIGIGIFVPLLCKKKE